MENLYLEVDDVQYDLNAIEKKVKEKVGKGKAVSDLKIYVKPSDRKAYYTAAEGSISGSVDI